MRKINFFKKTILLLVPFMGLMMTSCEEATPEKEEVVVVAPIVSGMEISISSLAGESLLTIAPAGAWTAKLTDGVDWLAVSPAEGTVEDKQLTFEVKTSNTTAEQRKTELTFVVGLDTTKYTVVQNPVQEFIKIFNDEIIFSAENKVIVLERIITNVEEIEVSAKPEWIESVEFAKVVDGAFTATITLKAGDFNTTAREGIITFKDKNSAYTYDCAIKSAETTDAFVFSGFPSEIIGYSKEIDTLSFEINLATKVAGDYDLFFWTVEDYAIADDNPLGLTTDYIGKYELPWVKLAKPVAQEAGDYLNRNFTIKVNHYYKTSNDPIRTAAIIAVPVGTDIDTFDPMVDIEDLHAITLISQEPVRNVIVTETPRLTIGAWSSTWEIPLTGTLDTLVFKSKANHKVVFGTNNETEHDLDNCGIEAVEGCTVTMISEEVEAGTEYTIYKYEIKVVAAATRTLKLGIARVNAAGKFDVTPGGQYSDPQANFYYDIQGRQQ